MNICPSGACGSIGVLSVHEDHSKELEKAGVKPTVITSSKYKAEGSPFSKLDDDARNEIQSKVDAFHDMFTASVARGRGVTESVVNRTFGQGRMLLANPARAAGMVDSISTLAQVLRRLGGSDDGAGNSSGALSIGRASSDYLPLSARLAAVRARACQAEVEASARPDNPPPSSPSPLAAGMGPGHVKSAARGSRRCRGSAATDNRLSSGRGRRQRG